MNRVIAGLFAAGLLLAEDVTPGFSTGTLTSAENGMVEVLTTAGAVVRCGFDNQTWIERNRQRVSMSELESGTPVELLTDKRNGRCYTRTLRLVSATRPSSSRPVARTPMRSPLESIFPRGNLTFGGVVIRRSPTVLIVRTRTEPEKVIRLRDDTRYVDSGSPATAADVTVNTRVFLRCGKNLDNDVEAYQVIWGRIDGPAPITSR